ncbi:hypothetical protein QQZ08_011649 [Neonectria magnoliae]|uniref:Uncharacterized protein n=1 Tax=Neonectria magnoliae TaxID=2732573 RepID=A0ABR1H8Y2_9HYPO
MIVLPKLFAQRATRKRALLLQPDQVDRQTSYYDELLRRLYPYHPEHQAMPSYFYHLKFELYPTPNPVADGTSTTADTNIWLPPSGATIFDEFPSHPPRNRRPPHPAPTAPLTFQQNYLPSTSTTAQSSSTSKPSVIDCGSASREPSQEARRRIEIVPERRWLERINSFPPPPSSAAIRPQTAVQDWRFGRVSIETLDLRTGDPMASETNRTGPSAAPSLGPTFGGSGTATKAKYLPLETKNTEVGWGVVHFYREAEETPGLTLVAQHEEVAEESNDDDCSTLCIPAVPAYMSPGDLLGFLGGNWREDISHCRMVMTSKMNRYLVLLKFRDGKRAKAWRREFEGKVFNTMEPQICHVVFVKSITFETPNGRKPSHSLSGLSPSAGMSSSLRPFPPPTPNLVELPTCPVCLERMDETNGLMTIPCSHVFHCTCLQNWKGAGCPVCRFTNTSPGAGSDPSNPYNQPFGSHVSNLCSVCDCTDDLWICLICGYVGCGRYKGGHAKEHWKETAHSFSLELETQHVWDYAGDMWVHRLIRDKGDGKVVELPGRSGHNDHQEEDVVPRAKLDSIGLEYTHLITSQLETQRIYYDELIKKAVDKASKASAAAEDAAGQASTVVEKLTLLEDKYRTLSNTIPQLERDLARERNKATKSEHLARSMGKALQEEKRLNEGLMKRIEHLNVDHDALAKQVEQLREENAELKEMNRDLTMFISGQEKLKELEEEGKVDEGEIEGGSASVPEKKSRRRGKK